MKIRENPSNGREFVPCVRTDGQTDIKKLTVFFVVLRTCLKMQHRIFKYNRLWHITDLLERHAPCFLQDFRFSQRLFCDPMLCRWVNTVSFFCRCREHRSCLVIFRQVQVMYAINCDAVCGENRSCSLLFFRPCIIVQNYLINQL